MPEVNQIPSPLPLQPPLRLFLIDERIFMLETLHAFFAACPGFTIVGSATHEEHALPQIAARKPAIVLIDASNSPGVGFDLAHRLASNDGPAKLVFLDDCLDQGRVATAMRIGASGYFLRQRSIQTLLGGLQRIANGGRHYDPQVAASLKPTGKSNRDSPAIPFVESARLTPREIEVLCLLAQGLSVKQCARHLNLAESTIDNHKSRLMKKLGVRKSTQLALIAVREGLISS